MNTKNTLVIISLLAVLFFTQKTDAQTTIGGGIVYGTEVESAGINVTGQYFINENIAIAPSFTYYFPKEIIGDFSFKWYEINADGNYYFTIPDSKIKPYGLAGLNLSIITFPTFSFGGFGTTTDASTTKFGFNIGAGADFDLGKKITPFAQIKYTVSEFNQLAILAGVRFAIGK